MGFTWNPQQQQVIDFCDSNLLVSAAAGSGKTAVLTEHVVRRVLDQEKGCDINELLIMTFTAAAATEMKERIRAQLNTRLTETTDINERNHIRRQLSLLPVAQISTIHSFCNTLIREYFYKVNLAPGSKIGDSTELKLMLSDIIEEVLDLWFAKTRGEKTAMLTAFEDLVFLYGENARDALKKELTKIYEHSRSHADPLGWLDGLIEDCKNTDASYQKLLLQSNKVFTSIPSVLCKSLELTKNLYADCAAAGNSYAQGLVADQQQILKEALSIENNGEKLIHLNAHPLKKDRLKTSNFKNSSLSSDEFTLRRSEYIDPVVKLIKEMKFPDKESFTKEQEYKLPIVTCIVTLLKEIDSTFSEQKRKKRMLDYNDLEHIALELLGFEEIRKDYQNRFREILVDEYQDSSEVQNTILDYLNVPDKLFMVGDVKQSIYAFRQAKPQYFMEKYDRYKDPDFKKGTCICLNQNYRSRQVVLDSINHIFAQIMQKTRGGIEYDIDNALHVGKEDYTLVDSEQKALTIHHIWENKETMKEFSGKRLNPLELEAFTVAEKIKSMVSEDQWKGETPKPVSYRDIVILARTVKHMNKGFMHILQDVYGIPCIVTVGSAYFDTLEINTLMCFLQIVDNPRQDIPLLTTLTSAMFGFTNNELARIRTNTSKKACFYERLLEFTSLGALGDKVAEFLEKLNDIREHAAFLSLPELLEYLMVQTDYRSLIAAMPGAKGRIINIDMLIQKAKDFEHTNYSGVYQFLRYVNKIKEKEIELEAPATLNEADDVVRIMTIHKSKGLEFPIVFLVGSAVSLVHNDTKSKINIHPDLGLSFQLPHTQNRVLVESVTKPFFKKLFDQEQLYEELRVLYVALTRAKGYLHIVACSTELPEIQGELPKERMGDDEFTKYKNFEAWIFRSILRSIKERELQEGTADLFGSNDLYGMFIYDALEYNKHYRTWKQVGKIASKQENLFKVLERMLKDPSWTAQYRKEIETISDHFEKKYAFQPLSNQKAIVSVSELKHAAMEEYYGGEDIFGLNDPLALEASGQTNVPEQKKPSEPKKTEELTAKEKEAIRSHYLKKKNIGPNQGAARGTAYHEILQRLNFAKITNLPSEEMADEILRQKSELLARGLSREEEWKMVTMSDFVSFFESPLAKRMAAAEKLDRLYTEKRFMFGIPVQEYLLSYAHHKVEELDIRVETAGDLVLLRGIIDGFFEENGSYVIMDYKTDHVWGSHAEEELKGRYRKQLEIYKKALEQMTGKTVAECILYSFALHKEVIL